MKKYEFHSALPPEKLKKELDREVQVRNHQERGKCSLFLKWRSEKRFTFCMVEYEGSVGIGFNGTARDARRRRGAIYSAILCGEITPDGEGSVIVGRYKQLLTRWLLCFIAVGCFIGLAVSGQMFACLLTAALGVPFLYSMLAPLRSRSGGALWAELEHLVATADSHAAG